MIYFLDTNALADLQIIVGGLHSKNCFTCKRPGTVLECYNCPRSYHRRCLDPPIHGNFKLDGPWFCPNCALLMSRDDNGDSVAGTMISHQKKKSEEMGMKIEVDVDNVTPLHREKEISLEPKRSESPTRLVSRHPLPKDVVAAEQHGKYHKKSRYSTLSSDIDEALGLLNRELEQARQRTMIINEMTAKIKAVEQEREMWKGRAELLAIDRNAVLELGLAAEVKRLRADNGVLKKATETLINESKRKEQEWEGWRRDMQTLINEK